MTTIMVKPAPGLPLQTAALIVHPASGSMLDAAGKVPPDGKPWAYDSFTCRLLSDGTILRADDPAFAVEPAPEPAPDGGAPAAL